MLRNSVAILVGSLLGSLTSLSAQAFPVSSAPAQIVRPDTIFVAGGCGIGFHRSVYGYCVRNGYAAAPYYAPPAVVAPPPYYAAPAVVAPPPYYAVPVRRPCAYGYRFDANGICVAW